MEPDERVSDRDFRGVCELLYESAGIYLSASKRQMVSTRLRRRLLDLSLPTVGAYVERVRGGDADELQTFVNLLTTNKTSFFREPEHFDHLRSHLERRMDEMRPSRLRLWSAASSTGEEAYSMTMTALSVIDNRASIDLRVLATDIDTTVLETARRAIYPDSVLEDVPERQRRWFVRGTGPRAGWVRPTRAVRSLVSFRKLNLREPPWPPKGPFDAIFCRNVLIYFDPASQVETVRALSQLLSPTGFLYLGHAEGLIGVRAGLVPSGHATFRLPEAT